MRDPMRWVQLIERSLASKKSVSGEPLQELRGYVESLLEAMHSLDVVVEVQSDEDQLACQLLSIGQAFARGEAAELDDQGFKKLGDTATELADELYAYATEE